MLSLSLSLSLSCLLERHSCLTSAVCSEYLRCIPKYFEPANVTRGDGEREMLLQVHAGPEHVYILLCVRKLSSGCRRFK